ncbi:hypothetical protein JAU75_11055 [Ochrobactrum sp. Q0168]|uniref:hypothetical protein n=1 Tax=Ochrobactrum sp. Q0168 TaxID=2793241 RepID=UPI0018EDABB9|nr:hypothetical protein [Ochrobactrum sp. Q0168]
MYNQFRMRKDIETIGIRIFQYEEYEDINEELRSKFIYGRGRKNIVNDLTEYCWQVYQKARYASGPAEIGRVSDLWVEQNFIKYNIINKEDTLWHPDVMGNILKIDKWACIVNDSWVLGGIHRHADFKLSSNLTPDNLWNHKNKYHIVLAREIMGLLEFGYEMVETKNHTEFICKNYQNADRSDLPSYDSLMKGKQLEGFTSIRALILNSQREALLNDIKRKSHSKLNTK